MVLEFSGEPSAALPVLGGSSAIRKLRFHSLYETPPFGDPREIQLTTGVRVPPLVCGAVRGREGFRDYAVWV